MKHNDPLLLADSNLHFGQAKSQSSDFISPWTFAKVTTIVAK
jgi:hypothetical protein